MDFVVETGAGLSDATSYVTAEFVIEYAVATGATVPGGDPAAAAVAGTLWLDGHYGARYPGTRKLGRAQGLGWPRTGATDRDGEQVADDAVPAEVMRATAAAALREMAAPGSLAPDVAGGGAIRRERKRLATMEEETEFAVSDGAGTPGPRFPEIEGILAGILTTGSGGGSIDLLRA